MADLSLEEIKNMPPKKLVLIGGVGLILLGYFYYMFLFQPLHTERKNLQTKLSELEQKIVKKEHVAKEVERNKEQLIVLKEDLKSALTKLPDQKEIPGLLSALSDAGRNAGLEFVLFEPTTSVNKEFYDEIPVKLTVNGGFHDMAVFFEKVARLPRIVNITDLSMGGGKETTESGYSLTASCRIKTYMFVEKAEKKDDKKKDVKKP